MRAVLTALGAALLPSLAPLAAALAAPVEPIDDLQRLFIEDTVALVRPPSVAAGQHVRGLMRQAGEARARGDNGEMRRYLAEARVVLGGGQWDVESAFVASLELRPARVVLDSGRPLDLRVAQFFAAPPPGGITLRAGFRLKGSGQVEWRGEPVPLPAGFPKAPASLMLSSAGLADGTYDLVVAASVGGRPIGQATLQVFVVAGLDRDLAEIARRAALLRATPAVRSSLAWPGDLARTLDDRSRQVTNIAWRPLLDRTFALLAEAERGRDPLTGARGDAQRHYASAVSGRIEPYRIYMPKSWSGKSPLPLVVLLHGSNGDQNRMLASGKAIALAEQYGWALLSPMGYSPNSGWGNHLPVVLADGSMPAPRPSTIGGVVLPRDEIDPEPAERDVMDTIVLMRAEYPIDPRRIYLAGNSMGGEGTWHFARLWPDLWAAVAPGAGAIAPQAYPYARLGRLPVLGVHGDRDEIISFAATREMIDRLNAAGGAGEMLAVAGGGHRSFEPALDQVFAFFAKHSLSQPGRIAPASEF